MYYQKAIKRKGKVRILTIPTDELRAVHDVLLPYLNSVELHHAAHGFVRGRSTSTNATVHLGSEYLLNVDLKDFFPSVTRVNFINLCPDSFWELPQVIIDWTLGTCFYNGALPQGSSCSPVLSNIFMYNFDIELASLADRFQLKYTRFADDITFSGSYEGICSGKNKWWADFLKLLDRYSLSLNLKKTVLRPFHQRQEVTGICINNAKLGISRKKREEFFLLVRGRPIEDLSEKEKGFLSYARSVDERYYEKICKHLLTES